MIKLKQQPNFSKVISASLMIVLLITAGLFNDAFGHSKYAKRAELKIMQDTLKDDSKVDGVKISKPGKIILLFRYNKSLKKGMPVSKKLIVINGKIIESGTIGGVEDADYFLLIESSEGVKKFGDRAEFGVIEAIGPNAKTMKMPVPPPSGPPPVD